jgi:hypothetical protein
MAEEAAGIVPAIDGSASSRTRKKSPAAVNPAGSRWRQANWKSAGFGKIKCHNE